MDARKGGGAPDRWFFITPRRIGHDLQLLRNRVPLGRRQLAAEFEEAGSGALYDRVGEYRVAVDEALFKLGPRYLPLIDLLIQLRQPQLMRDMKEDLLSDALSEALPPVPEPLITEVAESFQGLDTDRQRTEEHRAMLDSVESFRDGYRQYLAVAVRRLCEVVRTGHSQFEQAARDLRRIDEQLAETSRRLSDTRGGLEDCQIALSKVVAEIATLHESPEMRSKDRLDQAMRRAQQCDLDCEAARAEWERATTSLNRETAERDRRAERSRELRETVSLAHRNLARSHQAIALPGTSLFDWENSTIAGARTELDELIYSRKRSASHLRQRNAEIASRYRPASHRGRTPRPSRRTRSSAAGTSTRTAAPPHPRCASLGS